MLNECICIILNLLFLEMESATISDKNFKPEILQAKSIEPDDPEKLQNKCTVIMYLIVIV